MGQKVVMKTRGTNKELAINFRIGNRYVKAHPRTGANADTSPYDAFLGLNLVQLCFLFENILAPSRKQVVEDVLDFTIGDLVRLQRVGSQREIRRLQRVTPADIRELVIRSWTQRTQGL